MNGRSLKEEEPHEAVRFNTRPKCGGHYHEKIDVYVRVVDKVRHRHNIKVRH
jgi:hypothetical protein